LKKNISDGVESRNGSNGTPLNPPLFWLDNIFNRTFSRHCFFVNIVLNYMNTGRGKFFGKNGLCVKVCTKPNITNPTENIG
jgi:hypothetical protein